MLGATNSKIDYHHDHFRLIKMSLSTCLSLASAGLVGTFIWELVARKKSSRKKPSVAIAWTATKSKNLFTTIGRGFGWVSSYLTIVDLQDLCGTLDDLFRPTCNLMLSPLSFFKGYWETANKYKYPILVVLGSMLFFGGGFYLNSKFGLLNSLPPSLHRVVPKFLSA